MNKYEPNDSIDMLPISDRLKNTFRFIGINTVSDIKQIWERGNHTAIEFKKYRNVGMKSAGEFEAFCSEQFSEEKFKERTGILKSSFIQNNEDLTKLIKTIAKTIAKKQEDILWEQRRYEIAKAAMQGRLSNQYGDTIIGCGEYEDLAISSVKAADALIAELKKGDAK